MTLVYTISAILGWALIAFALVALCRETDTRADAHVVAWVTAFWPVTIPIALALGIVFGTICGMVWVGDQGGRGIGKLGTHYINFIAGR
jgi:hypothetical protein